MLELIKLEFVPITSKYPSKTVIFRNHFSGTILKFVYFLVVNNNKYLSYVIDNIIFGISVPDYPSRIVESNSLRLFWNFCIFCLLYIHINDNKFTYDKFKSAKFGFSILDMLFTFLISTADKEIYNIFNSFLFP